MPKLFENFRRVLTGDYFKERSRRKAEELAAERRAEEERERAQKEAEDRKKAADAARWQEECRRKQAVAKKSREEAEEAARTAKEQKAASVEAYLNGLRKIDQRDWKETLRVQMSAPKEIPYSRTDGVMNSFNNRRFWGGWHRTSKGWRKG